MSLAEWNGSWCPDVLHSTTVHKTNECALCSCLVPWFLTGAPLILLDPGPQALVTFNAHLHLDVVCMAARTRPSCFLYLFWCITV